MDVRFQWFSIFLCILASISCSSGEKAKEGSFLKASDQCVTKIAPERFLVRWKSGTISVEKASSEEQFVQGFLKNNQEDIELAENDFKVQLDFRKESSTQQALVVGLDNWGAERVEAAAAWTAGFRGQNIIVAVVDSGMDVTHPQLKDQVAPNPGEIGTDAQGRNKSTNGVDDDKNGYVDDFGGYDFVYHSPLVTDTTEHGSHVSGIISAFHNDTTYAGNKVQGLAPAAKILPLDFINENDGGYVAQAIEAIDYAVHRGAKIINASWGGPYCSTLLRDKITSLNGKNILFVTASGNEGLDIDQSFIYPASFNLPAQLTIGAVGTFDSMTDFSNYGRKRVHLFAPGLKIFSTVPGGYAAFSGTSMAAPFASGAAATLWSARPSASAEFIRQRMLSAVDPKAEYLNASQGRLNVRKGLESLGSN